MADQPDERLGNLEVRYAFLEQHVAEQDRAMLELAERIDRLETRLRQWLERDPRGGAGELSTDERPPHY